jgi:hypothetical protein
MNYKKEIRKYLDKYPKELQDFQAGRHLFLPELMTLLDDLIEQEYQRGIRDGLYREPNNYDVGYQKGLAKGKSMTNVE